MQPHLALSSIFLLGLRGIEKKLKLPGPPVSHIKTAEQRSTVRKLATSLEIATKEMMKPDSVAREIFGDEFVDHFGGTREHEVGLWNAAVTNWERESPCCPHMVFNLRCWVLTISPPLPNP